MKIKIKKLVIATIVGIIATMFTVIPSSVAFDWKEFPTIDENRHVKFHYWETDNIFWGIYYNEGGKSYCAIGKEPVKGLTGELTVIGQPVKWYWHDVNKDSCPFINGDPCNGPDVKELLFDEAGDGLNGNEITPSLPLSIYSSKKSMV